LKSLVKEGISEIVVNVHHYPKLIVDFLNSRNFNVSIKISDETDKLLETGGALKKAAPLLSGTGEPVLMYNVDVLSTISIADLYKEHKQTGALATLVVRNRVTQRYFKFSREKRLVGWINRKTGEKDISVTGMFDEAIEMAFSGIHIASPEIFNLMPPEDRFSMTRLYLDLAKDHLINGYFDESELWMDVGKPEELAKARRIIKNQ
jgi:NDP-sugar pyrophosphorylase family protein